MTEEYINQPMFTYLGNKRKLLDFIEEEAKEVVVGRVLVFLALLPLFVELIDL
jgi:hypothetical protein